jgi:hypothetical protein
MDIGIAVTLALAIGGLLWFVAYTHPKEFGILSPVAQGAVMLVFIGAFIWTMARMRAKTVIIGPLDYPARKIADSAIDTLFLPDFVWFAFGGLFFVLRALTYLPALGIVKPGSMNSKTKVAETNSEPED